jgi:hypothetical protein
MRGGTYPPIETIPIGTDSSPYVCGVSTPYLFTPEQWEGQREQFCQLVGKPTNARTALEACKEELATAMGNLEKVLGNRKAGTGEVRLSPGGELIIPPLSAEDIPAEAAALKEELAELLPLAPIASLLVELDRRTGFLDCFTRRR